MSSLKHPPLPHCQPPDLKDVRGMEAISGGGSPRGRPLVGGASLRGRPLEEGWEGLGQAGRD